MASSPTFKKRQKELARQERQREKAVRREQRKAERGKLPPVGEAIDPADAPIPTPSEAGAEVLSTDT